MRHDLLGEELHGTLDVRLVYAADVEPESEFGNAEAALHVLELGNAACA